MHPFWVVDKPDIFREPEDPSRFEVKGWIASLDKVDKLAFADAQTASALPLTITSRPDVEAQYRHLVVTGFEGTCAFDQVRRHDCLTLIFVTQGQSFEIVVPVHHRQADVARQKLAKLNKLMPHLRCPYCAHKHLVYLEDSFNTVVESIQRARGENQPVGLRARALLAVIRFRFLCGLLRVIRGWVLRWKGLAFPARHYLICPGCHAAIRINNHHFNFLPDPFLRDFSITPTGNVSANKYDGVAMNHIYRHRNGLILDCGAGLREKCYENVVNYEVVLYDSTDVLGVVERLPFKDNTFDVVFSFAVLEHVKDPFAGAREMIRVLKPGGMFYCQAPFLAPLHGYPHHYFNMSKQGLNRLFEGLVDIERLDVLNFGQPVFALSWILNFYAVGLPPDLQEAFRQMKVSDLLKPGGEQLGAPFVSRLSSEVQDILSCCNCLIGRKRTITPTA